MDANRYFEEMHRAMSSQKSDCSLILSVKVQQESLSQHLQISFSTQVYNMRTKEICQELFNCNSSAMDISERKNHACMIFRTNMFMR